MGEGVEILVVLAGICGRVLITVIVVVDRLLSGRWYLIFLLMCSTGWCGLMLLVVGCMWCLWVVLGECVVMPSVL